VTYRIVITGKAGKEMRNLPKHMQLRVDAAINLLRENPFAGKKLQGEHAGIWSLRVWPYRVLYVICQKVVTVTVFRVGHRQGVYK